MIGDYFKQDWKFKFFEVTGWISSQINKAFEPNRDEQLFSPYTANA